jgi:hypothetical protein
VNTPAPKVNTPAPKVTTPAPKVTPPPPKPSTGAPARSVPAGEIEAAAKQASRFKGLATRFLGSVGRIAKAVLGPITVALQILDAVEMIEATESAVRGEGFIFRAQRAEAADLSKQVFAVVKSYRDSRFHETLDELVRSAIANDEKYSQYDVTPGDYWGTEELSEFCLKVTEDVSNHANNCEKLHDTLSSALRDVRVRYDYCKAILSNTAAMAALSYPSSVPAARVFMAYQDLDKIIEILSPAMAVVTEHLAIALADRKLVDDNILQRGLVV